MSLSVLLHSRFAGALLLLLLLAASLSVASEKCYQAEMEEVPEAVLREMSRESLVAPHPRSRYLDLLAASVTGALHPCAEQRRFAALDSMARGFSASASQYPALAITLEPLAVLENVRALLLAAAAENIRGGFLEAGVWRGGMSVWALGVIADEPLLRAEPTPRKVSLADSFRGLPLASTSHDHDAWARQLEMRVAEDTVRATLASYGFGGADAADATTSTTWTSPLNAQRNSPVELIPGEWLGSILLRFPITSCYS